MNKNIISFIGVLIFVAILFLLVLPTQSKTSFLRGELKTEKATLKDTEEVLEKVKQLKQNYDSHKNDINKLYYVLPSGSDIPNLIVQLEALASENGLILKGVNFVKIAATQTNSADVLGTETVSQASVPGNLKTLGVNLSVVGSYKSFKDFLGALELNVRLMDIETIAFSSEKEAGGFIFSIELKVYYQ